MAKGAPKASSVEQSGDLPTTPTASSSTTGFFQSPPKLHNQLSEDVALQRVFSFWLPESIQSRVVSELSTFGDAVLQSKVTRWTADAETHPPTLQSWDIWGKRKDELITSDGWRNLQDMGIAEGIVAIAYENQYAQHSRTLQFLKYHLWTGSCAYVTCPSAMTDGAARLLSRHLGGSSSMEEKKVFRTAYEHLVSRDPATAWTSGQWMTERVGGSDVRNTETVATYSANPLSSETESTDIDGTPLGPWLINGFKWFSSATDADMAILLAKTPDGGVSAFYAPMRQTIPQNHNAEGPSTTELNGIAIQRLKSKLGTRALPTAELTLQNTRAYLLGTQGQGIKEISTILNITRIHTAVTAVGLWARGLAISRAFARVRRVQGKLLMDVPAHVRTMATQHVEYRAYMHMTYFVISLLGVSEQPPPPSSPVAHASPTPATNLPPPPISAPSLLLLLRLLTPVLKALTAKAAIAGLAENMESLGGVGYLDSTSSLDIPTNVARLYRDVNVLSIWEGTTDVMAADTVRVLAGVDARAALQSWVHSRVGVWRRREEGAWAAAGEAVTAQLWQCIGAATGMDARQLRVRGRWLMRRLGWVVCAVLLVEDARRDGDEVAAEVARRWVGGDGGGGLDGEDWSEEWDRRIVFGGPDGAGAGAGMAGAKL